MAQIKVTTSDFNLKTTYTCVSMTKTWYTASGTLVDHVNPFLLGTTGGDTPARQTVRFEYSLPSGAIVSSAKIYATLGSPLNGTNVSTICGEPVGYGKTVSVDVTLEDGASYYDAVFRFLCNKVQHNHISDSNATYYADWAYAVPSENNCDVLIGRWTKEHTSSLSYKDVYLLIDYTVEGEEEPDDPDIPGGDEPGGSTGSDELTAADFSLVSRYNCNTRLVERYTDSGAIYQGLHSVDNFTTDPTEVEKTVTFNYTIPAGAVVKTAKLYATVGSPKYAADILTINGVSVPTGQDVVVDVALPEGASSVDVPFVFRTVAESHNHIYDGTQTEAYWGEWNEVLDEGYYTRWFNFQHSSAVEFKNLRLVLEYEENATVGWQLIEDTVEAGSSMLVQITSGNEDCECEVWAKIGDYFSMEIVAAGTQFVNLPTEREWLNAIPDAESGTGMVVFVDGEGTLQHKTFTLICPEDVVPTFDAHVSKPVEANGETYQTKVSGYVSGKNAVTAAMTNESGAYGSTITSRRINIGGKQGAGYNTTGNMLVSPTLTTSGLVPITFEVTDSRGRTTTKTEVINVMSYQPPWGELKVWRVNDDGIEEEKGAKAKYELALHYSSLADVSLTGQNYCNATLKVDGKTVQDVPDSGWLLPDNVLTFDAMKTYAIEVVITDIFETATVVAMLPAISATMAYVDTSKRPHKRGFIFGDYDTASDGEWTLTGWSFPEPEYQSNMVAIPGRDGLLDLSTALTDGEPRYGNRTLNARFECSEGTRLDREDTISRMVNCLDGRRVKILLPDDSDHYVVGRMSVRKDYNDMAHAAVEVTVDCEPWRYSKKDTRVEQMFTSTPRKMVLTNSGRRVAIPKVTVSGVTNKVTLVANGKTWELTSGEYKLPDLTLRHGNTVVEYSGKGMGMINFSYQEAVL